MGVALFGAVLGNQRIREGAWMNPRMAEMVAATVIEIQRVDEDHHPRRSGPGRRDRRREE